MKTELPMVEMKACPFCNSDDPEMRPMVTQERGRFFVICVACSAFGPARATEAEAIAAWNTRTILPTDDAGLVERRFAELRHWFFQRLGPEQRTAFLFAVGIAPRTCDLTLGMQHQAIRMVAERLEAAASLNAEKKALEQERDEWTQQHENLVGVRQADLAALEAARFRWQEMCRRALAYLPSTLGITRDIREALPPYDEARALDAEIDAALNHQSNSQKEEGHGVEE